MYITCQLVSDNPSYHYIPERYKDTLIQINGEKYKDIKIIIPSNHWENQRTSHLGIYGTNIAVEALGEVELYDILQFDEVKLFVNEIDTVIK